MDGYQFIASVVGSTVWPLTIIGFAWLFHRPISALIERIKQLKYKDATVDFEKQLAEAEQEASKLPESVNLENAPPVIAAGASADLAPQLQVLESWFGVEASLRRLAMNRGVNLHRGSSPLFLTRWLAKNQVIDAEIEESLDYLRALRNVAAHSPGNGDISQDQANRYRDIAEKVVMALNARIIDR